MSRDAGKYRATPAKVARRPKMSRDARKCCATPENVARRSRGWQHIAHAIGKQL
jgi:hypothetical protein